MPTITIRSDHQHDHDTLVLRMEDYLLKLRDDKLKALGFGFKWESGDKNRVKFTGQGFDGHAALGGDTVELVVNLSLFLAPFKQKVEDSMRRGLERSLQA